MSRVHTFAVCAALVLTLTSWVNAESTSTRTLTLVDLSGSPGWRIVWRVPEAKLQDTGAWTARGEPPLTVSRAVEIARSYLKSTGRSDTLPLASVRLTRPLAHRTTENLFFYIVRFDDLVSEKESERDPLVVVLFDGSVVQPERSGRE